MNDKIERAERKLQGRCVLCGKSPDSMSVMYTISGKREYSDEVYYDDKCFICYVYNYDPMNKKKRPLEPREHV